MNAGNGEGNRFFSPLWTEPGAGLWFPVPPYLAGLFSQFLYKPVLGPVIRLVSGLVAIPVFRFLLRRVLRLQTNDAELERDLEHWFRGAMLLLAATANLEDVLFGWTQWHQNSEPWLTMLLRLFLAVGVIETMPDEDLFALVHRGPPKWCFRRGFAARLRQDPFALLKGLAVLHLKRSSPVLVIMCVVFGGAAGTVERQVGWWCYGLAVAQYLIIALATDRGRAAAFLDQWDPDGPCGRQQETMREAAGSGGAFAETDSGTGETPER